MTGDSKFNLLEAQNAVYESDLNSNEKSVALALLNHWSRVRETFPGIDRLAERTSLSRSTVIRALDGLEAKGAIVVTRSPGRANRYSLDALMSVTSATETPVSGGHGFHCDTPPVSERHPTRVGETPEVIQEVIQSMDPKKSAPSRARKPKLAPVPDPKVTAEHVELTKLYFEQFEAARGIKPPFEPRDGKAVRDLLAKCGPEAAAKAIRSAFADEWWRGKATIRTIANEPAKFLGLLVSTRSSQGIRAGDLLDRQLQRISDLERAERALP